MNSFTRRPCMSSTTANVTGSTSPEEQIMTRSNREFEQVSLEEQLFYRYFRPAKEKEDGEWLSPAEILEDIKKNSAIPLSNKRVSVFGRVLRKHEIPSKRVHRGTVYHVVRVL